MHRNTVTFQSCTSTVFHTQQTRNTEVRFMLASHRASWYGILLSHDAKQVASLHHASFEGKILNLKPIVSFRCSVILSERVFSKQKSCNHAVGTYENLRHTPREIVVSMIVTQAPQILKPAFRLLSVTFADEATCVMLVKTTLFDRWKMRTQAAHKSLSPRGSSE